MHHALGTVGHPDAYCQGLWQYGVVVNRELKQASLAAGAGVHSPPACMRRSLHQA